MCSICQALNPEDLSYEFHDNQAGEIAASDETAIVVSQPNQYASGTSIGVDDGGSTGGKPVYNLDQIADQLTDGYWESRGSTTHSFSLDASKTITVNLTGLTNDGKFLARNALETWEDVSGINFVETTSSGAQITFDDNQNGAFSNSYTMFGEIYSSTVNVSTNWLNSFGSSLTSYTHQTYIHEIGHALGLGHAGNYNGSSTYSSGAHYANDSWQASIMSYFSESQNTFVDAKFGYVVTPQMADILAIQNLYGANPDTRGGDTVYGQNATADANVNILSSAAATIYDGGGNDTINLSSKSNNQRLDLNAESFSDTNGQIGNLAIARGTVIENAITGSGNDTVIGNNVKNFISTGAGNDTVYAGAGDDTINAGAGSDVVEGGGGSDTFIISNPISSYNIVYDYSAYIGEKFRLQDSSGAIDTLFDVEWLNSGTEFFNISAILSSVVSSFGSILSSAPAIITALGDHIGNVVAPTPDPPPAPAPAPTPTPVSGDVLTFAASDFSGFGGSQDKGTASVSADDTAVTLENNAWKQLMENVTVTKDTVLSFDFSSTKEGEVHAIGFENDGQLSQNTVFQLDGTQDWGIQDFHDQYTTGSGAKSYDINVGDYFTGTFDRLVFIMDDDARFGGNSTFDDLIISSGLGTTPDPTPAPAPAPTPTPVSGDVLTFAASDFSGFGGSQDKGTASVSADGTAVTLENNAWKQLMENVTVTKDTVLSFDFSSTKEGEVHAIGFENDGQLSQNTVFQLDGTQDWGIQDFHDQYTTGSGAKSYDINVGDYFTGTFDRLVFIMDDDARFGGNSTFDDLIISSGLGTTPDPTPAPAPTPTPVSGDVLTFAASDFSGFGGSQDKGTASVSADGTAVTLENNAWKQLMEDITVTKDTVLSFDFSSTKEGEVHAIGFENDGQLSQNTVFQLDGTQDWGIQDFHDQYTTGSGAKSYDINVGDYFTGTFDRLVFIMDDDARFGGNSTFDDLILA